VQPETPDLNAGELGCEISRFEDDRIEKDRKFGYEHNVVNDLG
jgi:hypothetical protein